MAKVSEELAAADAEHQRLTEHVEHVEQFAGNLDAEHETLRRLAELRAAVSERMQSVGGDVSALRAAWSAVFDGVKVTPTADESVVSLVPHIKSEMLDYDDEVEGRLSGSPRRKALSLPANNSTGTQVDDQMRTSRA